MRVTSGKVEEVDASKSDQKSAEQRKGVDRVVCVESTKEDEGGTERRGGERHVV